MSKNDNNFIDIFENLGVPTIVCSSEFLINHANLSAIELFGFHLINHSLSEFFGQETIDFLKDTKNVKKPLAVNISTETEKNKQITLIMNKSKSLTILSLISSTNPEKNQAHLDFISTVSHELRTPLTSIKGFTDTLINSSDRLDETSKMRFLQIIKAQIERLTRLVENLLSISKLESQKSLNIFKSVNLDNYINELLGYLQPKTATHKIITKLNKKLPEIWVDTDKLEQILTNLIDNAVKYSKENTEIKITADFAANKENTAFISIADNGYGIPKENLSSIFNKFSRIDNPLTRSVQGTGLGLYITKSLIESINGTISVTSNEQGSTFTIQLPISTYEVQAKQHYTRQKD